MKKLSLLKTVLLLCALIVGSSSAWAEDITYTLTFTSISKPHSGSGYDAYNGSRSMDAVCTTDASKKFAVDITSNNVMMQSGSIQFKKNTGYLYNSTNLGTVTDISITSSAGGFNKTYGTSANPTSGAAGDGKGYFKIKENNTATGIVSQIVITFKFTIPTSSFNNSTVKVDETLDLRTLFSSNSDGDVTYTITSGDTNGHIESDGYTFTGLAEGSVTVKASQAAKGIYAAKEQSATITVVSAFSPSVVITPTTLAFGDVEVGQTKDLTFNITPANLTGALTIASNNGKYTVLTTSIAQDVTTTQTITVRAVPTAANDNMDGQISISGGGITTQYVTLSATPYIASAVTLVADPVGKGTFTYNEATVTSINSKVGASITVTAVPADGYLFDGWTATGATPASSDNAETEFTLTGTTPTLTASFIVDPRKYATLDGTDMSNMTNAGTSYGTVKTVTKDGLTWTADAYQDTKNTDDKMLQLRKRNHSSGVSYIKLPEISGNIQTISLSVTSTSATEKDEDNTAVLLQFQEDTSASGTVIANSGSTSAKVKTIDLSSLKDTYSTGYITVKNDDYGIRIWDITVAYIPTDINVSISSAKYATFCDHVDRDFSGKGITVYAAQANGSKVEFDEVTDCIVPANTGVVLYSATTKSNVAIPATNSTSSYDFSDNEMIGINTRTLVKADGGSSKTNYILSNETAGVGFYKAKTSGGYLAAHRAYLSTGAAGARTFLGFDDDETTGINAIENGNEEANNAVIYNLNGQRVMNPTKGLYVVNGKKVIIK